MTTWTLQDVAVHFDRAFCIGEQPLSTGSVAIPSADTVAGAVCIRVTAAVGEEWARVAFAGLWPEFTCAEFVLLPDPRIAVGVRWRGVRRWSYSRIWRWRRHRAGARARQRTCVELRARAAGCHQQCSEVELEAERARGRSHSQTLPDLRGDQRVIWARTALMPAGRHSGVSGNWTRPAEFCQRGSNYPASSCASSTARGTTSLWGPVSATSSVASSHSRVSWPRVHSAVRRNRGRLSSVGGAAMLHSS